MLGQTEFPRIGEHPYFLTLAPYGFYWFQLHEVVAPITARTAPLPEEHATLPSLFSGIVWESILDGGLRTIIERQALVPFLQRQRWFGAKARPIAGARFTDWALLRGDPNPAFLTIVEAEFHDGGRRALPASAGDGERQRRRRVRAPTSQRRARAHHRRPQGTRLRRSRSTTTSASTLLSTLQEARELPMRLGRVRGTARPVPARSRAGHAHLARARPQQFVDPVRQARSS